MAWEQVASGEVLDTASVSQYEDYVGEGERGKLDIYLRTPCPDWIPGYLRDILKTAGVSEVLVTEFPYDYELFGYHYQASMLSITYRKGLAWLPVIVGAVLGLIVLAALIVSWQFFREVVSVVPQPFKPLLGLAIVAGIGILVFGAVKKAVKEGII